MLTYNVDFRLHFRYAWTYLNLQGKSQQPKILKINSA